MKLKIRGGITGLASNVMRLLRAVLGIRSCTGESASTADIAEAFRKGCNVAIAEAHRQERGDTSE